MMDSDAQPTLLIFTLGPECEGARRQFMPAPLRQAESLLHQHGLCAALDAGRRAGLRLVLASPETLDLPEDVEQLHQALCSFAERLRRAVGALQAADSTSQNNRYPNQRYLLPASFSAAQHRWFEGDRFES